MKKVLFLANHFLVLHSFRKELIIKLVNEGHQVFLSLPKSEDNIYFENLGCNIIETDIDRRGVNPVKDLKLIFFYKKIINEVNPNIIFSYTIKPNIYGSLVSNGKYKQVCNITGTGATFLKENFLSKFCKMLYKISVKNCYKVYFQNKGDLDYFIANKMISNNYDLLPGSGCNLEQYQFVDMPNDDVVKFIFIGRVMKLKGIEEYLKAAEIIKNKYSNVEFYIAGWNEENYYKEMVDEYKQRNIVKYLGFQKDIKPYIHQCHCTVLASHGGEGVPNVLLESGASGRACIGTKTNGIVDVIDDGINGYIFSPGDYESLVSSIEKFINLNFEEKKKMGFQGRKKIEIEFDRNIVINKYLDEMN